MSELEDLSDRPVLDPGEGMDFVLFGLICCAMGVVLGAVGSFVFSAVWNG